VHAAGGHGQKFVGGCEFGVAAGDETGEGDDNLALAPGGPPFLGLRVPILAT